MLAFYCLRGLMFVLSFVLEDWALHELLPSARERTRAIALVASSYVTWTFQMHTFSNSIETLLVLWCIVLVKRIRDHPERTMASACAGLAFMGVLGVFNRITFPAFLLPSALQLVPHLFKRTLRIPILLTVAFLTISVAVTIDTETYAGVRPSIFNIADTTIFTPINNLLYNASPSNLAEHGLHPYYTHLAVNLPLLLGPAIPLLLLSPPRFTTPLLSAISGTLVLSAIPHQEPRFLLPCIPLLLSSLRNPTSRTFLLSWITFNVLLGTLFGAYHQAGVLPAQRFLERYTQAPTTNSTNLSHIFWWKTYPPPTWLDGNLPATVKVTDWMGLENDKLIGQIYNDLECELDRPGVTGLLVAPWSATFLDKYLEAGHSNRYGSKYGATIRLEELWRTRQHIGLDDLDWGQDGVWKTLRRVLGRRGLVAWGVRKKC